MAVRKESIYGLDGNSVATTSTTHSSTYQREGTMFGRPRTISRTRKERWTTLPDHEKEVTTKQLSTESTKITKLERADLLYGKVHNI